MVVGRGLALAAAGAAIGTGASLAGVRTLEGLLFGVSPFDAVKFAVLVVALIRVLLYWRAGGRRPVHSPWTRRRC